MEYSDFLKSYSLSISDEKLKIYLQAVTHPSFSNENRNAPNYERLEFLGDRALSFFIAKRIFINNPTHNEGTMSMMKAHIESGPTLSRITKEIGLNQFVRYGKSVASLKDNEKILADVFEAFVAAVFLNEGESVLNEFLSKVINNEIDSFNAENLKNPKTTLQELLQTEDRATSPTYVDETHEKGYKSTVIHGGIPFGIGYGSSKKEAQVEAAKNALQKLRK